MSGALLYYPLPYSTEAGPLPEPGARLVISKT